MDKVTPPDTKSLSATTAARGSATAAEAGYSGEELRRLHPTDLLRALQLIDPSICGTDPDERYGSDPNAVPAAMSLQGVRSLIWGMSDADARPLVIVDGHSESFDRLKDFDMQRIASVALLKNTTGDGPLRREGRAGCDRHHDESPGDPSPAADL